MKLGRSWGVALMEGGMDGWMDGLGWTGQDKGAGHLQTKSFPDHKYLSLLQHLFSSAMVYAVGILGLRSAGCVWSWQQSLSTRTN